LFPFRELLVFWETICCQTAHFYHFLVGCLPLRMKVAFLSLPSLCKPLAILWKRRILPLPIVLDAASPPNVGWSRCPQLPQEQLFADWGNFP
jgi:hypothetical protein